MNKKVDVISQHPLGIITCDNDPDIYNVCSFSTEYRIVDMLIFECSCPRKDKSFCSHIRAVSKKFRDRYTRELFNIFSILNEVNVKNSLANCNNKADNHFDLFIKSMNQYFHFSNLLDGLDISSFEAKQRYRRVINALIRALSSISWRYFLRKVNDQELATSIKQANSIRKSFCTDILINSINSSLMDIKRSDFSSVIEFFRNIELSSLKNIGICNSICFTDIFTKLISEDVLTKINKETLIRSIIEYLEVLNISAFLKQEKNEDKSHFLYHSEFGRKIIGTLKNIYNKLNDNAMEKEKLDFILMENFGIKLHFLGAGIEPIIIRDLMTTKHIKKTASSIIDLIALVITDENKFHFFSPKQNIIENKSKYELINVIHSAPIIVDLHDYLLWHSTTNNTVYGDLDDFILQNSSHEKLNSFWFVRFSKIHRDFRSKSSFCNNSLCIYKILKPNGESYSSSDLYYLYMIDSIANCNGINTLNYYIGGCIQQNGVKHFVDCFAVDKLHHDLKFKINNKFDIFGFINCIISNCPPILIHNIWEYIVLTTMNISNVKTSEFMPTLIKYLFKSCNWFAINNLIKVVPENIVKELLFKEIYNLSNKHDLTETHMIECKDDICLSRNFSKNFVEFTNQEDHLNIKCQQCLDKQTFIINQKSFINYIREKFGFSNNSNIFEKNKYLIENYSKIINQSCKNLSLNLYTRTDHYIFELIQNADDNSYCNCIGKEPTIIFAFYEKGLLIINNEFGFTGIDVESICDIGKSSKLSKEEKIGSFGIGFKSVFLITDTPHIFSNGYNFRFNSNSTNSSYILPEWVDEDINDIIPSNYNGEIEFELVNYPTRIWLPYSKTSLNIKKEASINEDVLIFTKNIKTIKSIKVNSITIINKIVDHIFCDIFLIRLKKGPMLKDEIFKRKKRKKSFDFVSERRFVIVNYDLKSQYNKFLPQILNNSERNSIIRIGIELISGENSLFDGECLSDIKMLYAFLPVRSYGFKFLLQADFELTSSRESIVINSPWNLFLRDHLPNALLYAIRRWRQMDGFHSLKKTFINILPSREDEIDSFFDETVAKFTDILSMERCIYTISGSFIEPSNSVFIHKTSHEIFLKLFPNINEFSFLLNKYCGKDLIHNYNIIKYKERMFLEALGAKEFDIEMLIEIISGMVCDFSYFGRTLYWYFDLFHLLENYISFSNDPDKYIRKLQYLPLLLTEEDRYIEFLELNSGKKQLFFCQEDLPSIEKLGIHFIKKNFVSELKEYFIHEQITYNKIITFIQNIGSSYIDKNEYIDIILNNLCEASLSSNEIIHFTSIIANNASKEQLNNKLIVAVNSKGDILSLSPKNFHLIPESPESSIMEYIYKLVNYDQRFEKYVKYFTHEFSCKYLDYGDHIFWNNFFREFKITKLPFFFQEILINIDDSIEYLNSLYLKYDSLINIHILENYLSNLLLNFSSSRNTNTISDHICIGIEALADLMSNCMINYIGNKDIENILLSITQILCNCICKDWDILKKHWFINFFDKNIPSFVKTQFSTSSLFAYLEKSENKFVFKGLSSPDKLTLFRKTEIHDAISSFVNFYFLDEDQLSIISEAFFTFIDIDMNYLITLIRSIHNSSLNVIKIIEHDFINPDSYIYLLDKIIKFSKTALITNEYGIFKSEIFLPLKDNLRLTIWKNLNEFYWNDDNNLLPEHQSLLYLFSTEYILSSETSDILKFFVVLLNVHIKPTSEHFIIYLTNIFDNKNIIEIYSKELFIFLRIVIYLFDSKLGNLYNFVKIPILTECGQFCKWVPFSEIQENRSEFFFSTSAYIYYFIANKLIKIQQKVLWSPILYLFSKNNSLIIENMDIINILIERWNLFCMRETINHIKIDIYPTNINKSLSLCHYSNIIINFLGPLFEESIRNYYEKNSRKNWKELISKVEIYTTNSNFSINCMNNIIETASFFDEISSILYIKNFNELKDEEEKNVVLSLLILINSFFPKISSINLKCINAANLIFKYIIRDFQNSKEQINWEKNIINWVKKIEDNLPGHVIDLKYFLFSDYKNELPIGSHKPLVSSQFQLQKKNCPKNIVLDIGRKGEYAAYSFLKRKYADDLEKQLIKIEWVNKEEETGLPYDILIIFSNGSKKKCNKVYIEVKSSSNKEKNHFYITFKEWQFAEKSGESYWILQVLGIKLTEYEFDKYKNIEYKIIKNPYELCKNGGLQMIISEY